MSKLFKTVADMEARAVSEDDGTANLRLRFRNPNAAEWLRVMHDNGKFAYYHDKMRGSWPIERTTAQELIDGERTNH